MRGDQPGHTCASAGTPAYTQECAQPCTWGQKGTGGRTRKKSWGTFTSCRPPAPQYTCAGSRRRLLAPPSLPGSAGAVVPSSPPGAAGPSTCCPAASGQGNLPGSPRCPGPWPLGASWKQLRCPGGRLRAWGEGLRRGGGRSGELPQPVRALRPYCRAGGSAGSAAPPTAAAALRAPPSRRRAPAPSAPPGAPTGSWRAGTARSCRGARPRWRRPRVRSRRPAGRARGRLEGCSFPRWR